MKGLCVFLFSALEEARSWPERACMVWLMFGAPLLVFAVLWILYGSGDMRELPVVICDQDRSAMSRRLSRWIDACPSMAVSEMTALPAMGERLLREGKAYAFILIPRNFERDIQRRRPVHFVAWLDGQSMAAAGLLKRDLSDAGMYFWREQDSRMRAASGTPREAAYRESATVSLDLRLVGNPAVNYRVFLLPGLLPTIIQLAASIASACSLERLSGCGGICNPQKRRAGTVSTLRILGSQAALALWFSLLGSTLSRLLHAHGDLVLHGNFFSLLPAWLLMCAASAALGHALYALSSSLSNGLSLISVYSSPAFAFAGLSFPLSAMPFLGRCWAMSLPVTHFVSFQTYVGQLGADIAAQGISLAALGVLVAVFTGAGLLGTARNGALSARSAPLDKKGEAA